MCVLDDGKEVMESSRPRRIDPPKPAISAPVNQRRRSQSGVLLPTVSESIGASESTPGIRECREGWLDLHAADLIGQLQELSADLDARESQLNVRASLQDSRERSFRLRQQDALLRRSEQQRALDRLQREIETQVRQLAFRDP
jgi:hypothetical protein